MLAEVIFNRIVNAIGCNLYPFSARKNPLIGNFPARDLQKIFPVLTTTMTVFTGSRPVQVFL